jgi:hypothetical protein
MVRARVMFRAAIAIIAACSACACVHQPQAAATPTTDCYTESGWLDSSNGCSVRAGYPDCYLVCPGNGTRRKL